MEACKINKLSRKTRNKMHFQCKHEMVINSAILTDYGEVKRNSYSFGNLYMFYSRAYVIGTIFIHEFSIDS